MRFYHSENCQKSVDTWRKLCYYYGMDDIREVVAKNIVTLRKENNWTQVELAQKINFSDKAVSRWEKGEVLPDLETFQKLSEVFNVPISSLLESQDEVKKKKVTRITKRDVLSYIFLICEIWIVIGVIYAYFKFTSGVNLWQVFVCGVPATALVLIIKNWKKKNNIAGFVYGTVFVWTLITALFFLKLSAQPWYFFLLGVPIQGMLIVRYLFNYKQFHRKSKK